MKTFLTICLLVLLSWQNGNTQFLNCPAPFNQNCVSNVYGPVQLQILRVGLPHVSYAVSDTIRDSVYASDANMETFPITRAGNQRVVGLDEHAFNIVVRDSLGQTVYDGESECVLADSTWSHRVAFGDWYYNRRSIKLAHLRPGRYTLTAIPKATQIASEVVSVNFQVTIPTAIMGSQNQDSFKLNQNYPNPFNSETVISFSLPRAEYVSLSLFNLLGVAIVKLHEGYLHGGYHTFNFSVQSLSSGIYFYRLRTNTKSDTKRLIILK